MSERRVFFYVQHLWGVGHVYRAVRIARALACHGFDVHLIWGGTRLPNFDFTGLRVHYLTPVRTSDASFTQLLHANGMPFSNADKQARREDLLALYRSIQPHVVITEAFPFGRRQMRFELIPMLEEITSNKRPKPLLAASIRDIMQEDRKPERVEESNRLIERFFDLVLVHGDDAFIHVSETLQGTETFKDKIRHTGLVVPGEIGPGDPDLACDVLVSVGGGAFGQRLTRAALDAMGRSKAFPKNWLVLAGTELGEDDYRYLLDRRPEGMRIERSIPDLASQLAHCRVSVSHSGYNTVADIVKTTTRAVLYPYTGGRESEQLRRASLLEAKGAAIMLPPGEISPSALAESVDQAAQLEPSKLQLNLNGANRTAELLYRFIVDEKGG